MIGRYPAADDYDDKHDDDQPLSKRKADLVSARTRAGQRGPLIDQISNRWRDEKSDYDDGDPETHFLDLEDEESCLRNTQKTIKSRRFRRMMAILLLMVGLGFWIWRWYLRPHYLAEQEMREGFLASNNSTYGIARAGDFEGTRLAKLDAALVPGGEHDPEGQRRLVFVGDIHGCADELRKLLQKVDFNVSTDHLIAVGDVISKGPDNVGVLDELMRLGASSVRGNHEDRVLMIVPTAAEVEPPLELLSKGAAKDRKILKTLKPKHIQYLQEMPLMLQIPALPQAAKASHKTDSPIAEDILVVHAGLVPSVTLEKQDPFFVMNMRSIRTKNHLPLAEADVKGSKPWKDIWGWYNDRLFRKKSVKDFRIWDTVEEVSTAGWFGQTGLKKKKDWPLPQVVVYGHHSKAGLQIERWSKGLDTGCVRGGKLTALVLDATGHWEILSVRCNDYR